MVSFILASGQAVSQLRYRERRQASWLGKGPEFKQVLYSSRVEIGGRRLVPATSIDGTDRPLMGQEDRIFIQANCGTSDNVPFEQSGNVLFTTPSLGNAR